MRKESLSDWINSEPYWRDTFRYCSCGIRKFILETRNSRIRNTVSWYGNKPKQASFHNRAHNRYSCVFETRTVYDTISFYKEY